MYTGIGSLPVLQYMRLFLCRAAPQRKHKQTSTVGSYTTEPTCTTVPYTIHTSIPICLYLHVIRVHVANR